MLDRERLYQQLDSIGLAKYSPDLLREKEQTLKSKILIGYQRPANIPPTMTDGGLLAIRTGINPISQDQWRQVKEGSTIIACAYGGTNWITSRVVKEDGQAKLLDESKLKIPIEDRQLSFDDFIERMALQITQTYQKSPTESIDTVAVSFGFAHENKVNDEDGSIDARLLSATPAKHWKIIDFDQHKGDFIGEALLKKLKQRGSGNIKHIVFQNDTNAVAQFTSNDNSVKELPIGFVFGTGDNAALEDRNLEIGKADLDDQDAIYLEMQRRKLLSESDPNNIIEYRMGGDYIKSRVIAAFGLVNQPEMLNVVISEGIIDGLMKNKNGRLISLIASESLTRDALSKELGIPLTNLNDDVYIQLTEIAKRALQQAGQMFGIVVASVTQAAGYQGGRGDYAVEGSVFWDGYNVRQSVDKTLNELIPGNELVAQNAIGLIGIAQLAMVRTQLIK